MQDDHLRASHASKKKDRTTESRKWQGRGVKINQELVVHLSSQVTLSEIGGTPILPGHLIIAFG